jgi:hypothetical protein
MKVGFIGVEYPERQEAAYVQVMYKQFMAEERRLKHLAAKVDKHHSQLQQVCSLASSVLVPATASTDARPAMDERTSSQSQA